MRRGTMGKARRLVILVAAVVVLATLTVGFALAQGRRPLAPRSAGSIHVVNGAGGSLQFFDFANDGLTLGDRLAAFGPLLNADQTKRVGTGYLDCWVGDDTLDQGSPYVCTNILRFKDGSTITTQGLDPHGVSDVFFAVTGGTGAYEDATGQAEYIDSESQTDIYIYLD
jgi:hypothetical protein